MSTILKYTISLLITFTVVTENYTQSSSSILDDLAEIAIVDQKVMMPMRDGIRLCTDIYRPKGDEKVPIIFSRTPYNFNSWGDGKERTRAAQRAYEAVLL